MGQAARKPNRRDADAWVTVDQAATLAGESSRTWQRNAMREASEATRKCRPSLAHKASPQGDGKPVWFVHRSMDARLARCPGQTVRDERTRQVLAAKHPQHLIDRALRRNHWLNRWRVVRRSNLTEREAAAQVVAEARQVESKDFKISVRSLARWSRCATRLGADGQVVGVDGLVDRYGGGDDPPPPTRSPEAVEYFYTLYHTENKIPVTTCHEVTLAESRRRKWSWPKSYNATVSWLEKHDDRSLTCLLRQGSDAWARKYLPHMEIDYSTIQPGYFYQGDHTPCDFWVRYKDRMIRPWLTVFQDVRSRCIVGWHIGPSPHQDAILSALRMAFRDWAIPSVMRIDNGRDFTSKRVTGYTKRERNSLRRAHGGDWNKIARRAEHLSECDDSRWRGVSGELDIELIYAIPYSPWSKGTTERFFGTFETQFGKMQPTYCGNTPTARPECVEAVKDDPNSVPTMDDVRRSFAAWLDIYHRTNHRGLAGSTPLGVWNTATSLRRALQDELAFLMEVCGLYKVTGNGVRVKVGSTTIGYGAKSPALKRLGGRKVLIAVDPGNIRHAWAYTPDRDRRKLIGRLDANETFAPTATAEDAREAIAEKKREQSIMHKARRASAGRTKTACERINEHAVQKRTELLATGTDSDRPLVRIVPVPTGFEGVSKPARTGFETESYRPMDSGELEELFDDSPSESLNHDDDTGMDDLFADDPVDDDSDDGLDAFYEA